MFKPYDFQLEAIQSIFDYFQNGGKGNPLVVAPTGSGKSIIIAEFIRIVKEKWPGQRILILSHDQEILSQDHKSISIQNPNLKIGLYSASLKSKEIEDITVAGIQSIYNRPELFADFNLIILDEAHTVRYDRNSMYMKFFACVNKKVLGFTATPFRLGTGYLHIGKERFFTEIIYTIKINELQKKGFLCKMFNKHPGMTLDASQIKKQAGDYIIKELSLAFDREEITKDIIKTLANYKLLRKKWLVYAIDIEHCEHITDLLNENGIKSAPIHSKTGISRSPIIDKFRNDEYQALVSVAMLTTGVDIPEVDLIVLLRPTASPVLHIQILGRGMRVAPDKEDCLVLDFAGNLKRNGPVDSPVIRLKGEGNGGEMAKVCDECDEIVHISVKICPSCGSEFSFKHHLKLNPGEGDVVSQDTWHEVDVMEYATYVGVKGIPMLLAYHKCGLRFFKKVVPLEHKGKARYLANFWWKRRCTEIELPNTAEEALSIANQGKLRAPKRILVNESGKYPEIKETEF